MAYTLRNKDGVLNRNEFCRHFSGVMFQ